MTIFGYQERVLLDPEFRRAELRRLGLDDFIYALNLMVVDADRDGVVAIPQEFVISGSGMYLRPTFLFVRDDSGWHVLLVPPTLIAVREAVAWTFGMTAEEYNPDLEV